MPRFRETSSEWKKRNVGMSSLCWIYVCKWGKNPYTFVTIWTYKLPISNVRISWRVPKAWRLPLSVKTKVLLFTVCLLPPAIVLLKENLKQNRMSLFLCCKTVSIDGFQSISKHALQLHQHRPVVKNSTVQGIYDAFLLRTMIPWGRSISHLCKKAKSCF